MRRLLEGIVVAALTMGGAAFAQGESTQTTTTTTTEESTAPAYQANPEVMTPAAPTTEPSHSQKMFGAPVKTPRFSVSAGIGADGFTAPRTHDLVGSGFSWGATVGARATDMLGLELAYSGSGHEVRENVGFNLAGVEAGGSDIVRNGVNAQATFGLPWVVQPYLLAGIGVNHYAVNGGVQSLGFRSDTSAAIPMGGGVRTNLGPLVADARLDYNLGLGEDIVPASTSNTGRYQAQFSLGARF